MSEGDVEAKFIEAIRNDPQDDEVRRVYADWLDERGDPRGEYLRLEIHVYRAPKRMAELAAAMDPMWIRTVQRRYRIVLAAPTSNKIGTIKVVREITGLGLKDSINLVERGVGTAFAEDLELDDARERSRRFDGVAAVRIEPEPAVYAPLPPLDPMPLRTCTAVMVAVRPGSQIAAIKRVREVLPAMKLTAAKELVDRVVAGTPMVVQEQLTTAEGQRVAELFAEIAEIRIDRS